MTSECRGSGSWDGLFGVQVMALAQLQIDPGLDSVGTVFRANVNVVAGDCGLRAAAAWCTGDVYCALSERPGTGQLGHRGGCHGV